MTPTWTILIATIGERSDRLFHLLMNPKSGLIPQIEAAKTDAVRVLALWNNGERPLGRVRQDLIEGATSDFTCFVDDDDELPPYYVEKVLAVLDDEIEYVGWRMQCIQDGRWYLPTYHSLRYWAWSENHEGYYRDISHLNPIRRRLALHYADFTKKHSDIQGAEDADWSAQLRGHLDKEAYIHEVMYYYWSSSHDTTWRQGGYLKSGTYTRPVINSPYFSWHPNSSRDPIVAEPPPPPEPEKAASS